MSGSIVLDSYALLAFLDNEPGAETVAGLIKQARDKNKPLLLSIVNWGEIFYILCRAIGKDPAEATLNSLDTLPIEVVPADRETTRNAALFKATRKMSYADCFAAALAKTCDAELITGDKEFKEVANSIKIVWL